MPIRSLLPSVRFLLAVLLAAMLAGPSAGATFAQVGESTHVVQPDETLSEIALEAGTDVETLLELNGLDDPNQIQAGQVLLLPSDPGAAASTQPTELGTASTGEYVVQEGDTLAGIAADLGVDSTALAVANGLEDADLLYVGMTLVIPAGSAQPADVASDPVAPETASDDAEAEPLETLEPPAAPRSVASGSGATRDYLVQDGDTLEGIAAQFDTSVEELLAANGMDDPNLLVAGVTIQVPAPGREHVVQPGETLAGIAAEEQVDLDALAEINGASPTDPLEVGQVLLLPDSSAHPVVAAAAPTETVTADGGAPTATPTPIEPGLTGTPSATVQGDGSAPSTPEPTPRPEVRVRAIEGDLASTAESLLGAPYVWGAAGPYEFDCSGFIWFVAEQAEMPIGRQMQDQYDAGRHPKRERLRRGDLVFFQNTYMDGLSHNGIYLGDGKFIHAADEISGVTISSLDDPFWDAHWYGATPRQGG